MLAMLSASRRLLVPQWRGLTLIAVSFASFVALVALAPVLDLPLPLRVVFSALAGLGMMAGQTLRLPRHGR